MTTTIVQNPTHDPRAIDASHAPNIPTTAVSARQGDLVLRRVGDPDPSTPHTPTPAHGTMIVSGSNGEHRVIADALSIIHSPDSATPGTISLPCGGLVVHTDLPHARHGTIRLEPGRYCFTTLREVSADNAIQQVID